jgi:hypothetical protein
MGLVYAGVWGLLGGLAAGLVVVSAAVRAAGFRWPWKHAEDGIWPQLFVVAVGVTIGALVAAAAHAQMNGPWPAFLLGVGAPSVVRGALSGVEVAEIKDDTPDGDAAADGVPSVA